MPGQIHMIAGSRLALKRCRDVLKKLDLPPMRHFKTSYSADLKLLVVPLHEMLARES
ncbi:MAG: hypothetical protein H8E15_08480 [Planctomycetes bacterium]|nr:hypothetical protein [Planctomycetota bacterium]